MIPSTGTRTHLPRLHYFHRRVEMGCLLGQTYVSHCKTSRITSKWRGRVFGWLAHCTRRLNPVENTFDSLWFTITTLAPTRRLRINGFRSLPHEPICPAFIISIAEWRWIVCWARHMLRTAKRLALNDSDGAELLADSPIGPAAWKILVNNIFNLFLTSSHPANFSPPESEVSSDSERFSYHLLLGSLALRLLLETPWRL
jgi:hypothetical protein